jgi:hypothetical protein
MSRLFPFDLVREARELIDVFSPLCPLCPLSPLFKVSNRPTSSIRFAIAPEKCGWVTVSDAVWHDTIVVSKPDTIRVIIDVSFAERARRESRFALAVGLNPLSTS